MTTATTSAQPGTVSSASPLRAVPIAIWALVGTLALATAGLTGALVMRSGSADTAVPASAQVAAPQTLAAATTEPTTTTSQLQAGTQVHAAQQQAATTAPAPKPARPAKPPTQVAHASQAQGTTSPAPVPLETTRAAVAVCASCGTVESVQPVTIKGEGTGLGAVAGGVLGGVLGHQVGGGNGKTAMTVLGAVGGGLAGNEVEKRTRSTTAYDVRVRMEDGSVRSFRQGGSIAVGTRVTVDGNALRIAQDGAGNPTAPRTLRTSAPAAAGA